MAVYLLRHYDRVAVQPSAKHTTEQNALPEEMQHAGSDSPQLGGTTHRLLQLQQAQGNQFVQGVVNQAREAAQAVPIVQPKLVLGAVGDRYEREADRVAQQVVGQLGVQSVSANPGIHAPDIQRVQGAGGGALNAGAIDAGVQQAIQGARGGGQPLPDGVRARMEQALSADFGGVRLHTDARSDALNQSLQARAFTTGQDIFFRRGAYAPELPQGQSLIAHELTHVMQQGSRTNQLVQRQLVSVNGALDHLVVSL